MRRVRSWMDGMNPTANGASGPVSGDDRRSDGGSYILIREKRRGEENDGPRRRGRPPKHGLSNTRAYKALENARQRCKNSKHPQFADYGGRGVEVRVTVEQLVAQIGQPPSPRHSLDRIDHDGHYEVENLRWVIRTEQQRNRRGVRVVEFRGQSLPVTGWARVHDVPAATIRARLDEGWSVERALHTPAGLAEKLPSDWAAEEVEAQEREELRAAGRLRYVVVRLAEEFGYDVPAGLLRWADDYPDPNRLVQPPRPPGRLAVPSLAGGFHFVEESRLVGADPLALADEVLDEMREALEESEMNAMPEGVAGADPVVRHAWEAWRDGVRTYEPDLPVTPWLRPQLAAVRELLSAVPPEVSVPLLRLVAEYWFDFEDYLHAQRVAYRSELDSNVRGVPTVLRVHRHADMLVPFHLHWFEVHAGFPDVRRSVNHLFEVVEHGYGVAGRYVETATSVDRLVYRTEERGGRLCRWYADSPVARDYIARQEAADRRGERLAQL